MRYLSICSGIEAATVAWHHLGWTPVAFSEIEPFPSAVLAHHYPNVPNLGDMTNYNEWELERGDIDLLVGGTPCQAFSVAGKRLSLDDERGNLSLVFCGIADRLDPDWIVWENVPGVLNTKDNAFGCFLAGLAGESSELQPPGGRWPNAGCVYGPQRTVAWRVLDAQYFGVAQRRRRVFVVASSRDGFDPAAVLFEFDGVRRDIAPRRQARESFAHATAPCLTSSGRGVERCGDTRGQDPVIAVTFDRQSSGEYGTQPVASTISARDYKCASDLVVAGDVVGALTSQVGETGKGDSAPCVATHHAVRRLTPTECERLQGFPDGYTNVPWRNKSESPDGPRYKSLGNSMAVPVMRWIGERLQTYAGLTGLEYEGDDCGL